MTYKNVVTALLAGTMTLASGFAFAQGPMNIDFAKMEAFTKQAIAAGDNNAAQTAAIEEATKEVKASMKNLPSPSVQRVSGHVKAALAASKAGKTAEAAEHLKTALTEMKQSTK